MMLVKSYLAGEESSESHLEGCAGYYKLDERKEKFEEGES